MIWAGIIKDRWMDEGVKVTSATYCNLLTQCRVPWIDDNPLSLMWDFIFMQDNAPSHPVCATTTYLAELGIKDEKLII